eukprot:1823990-Amphidinium_carterae.1
MQKPYQIKPWNHNPSHLILKPVLTLLSSEFLHVSVHVLLACPTGIKPELDVSKYYGWHRGPSDQKIPKAFPFSQVKPTAGDSFQHTDLLF